MRSSIGGQDLMATFKEAAQQRYGWDLEDFDEKVFFHCLEGYSRILARLLWPWRRRLFEQDLAVIRSVAEIANYNDVFRVAEMFADPRADPSFLRNSIKIRPRGRRLVNLARELLPARPQRNPTVESINRAGALPRKSDAREPKQLEELQPQIEADAVVDAKPEASDGRRRASDKSLEPAKGAALRGKKRPD